MAERDSEVDDTPGIVRALEIVRERVWVIVLCVVVAFVVAVAYVEHKPNVYSATASLEFTNNSLPSQVAGVGTGQSLDPEGEKNTNVQLVTTTPVAAAVVRALKLHETPSELLEQVAASDPQNDYIVDVTATDEDPVQAAAIANSFAQRYVIYSQQQNEEQLVKGQQLISQRIDRLPAGDTADRANLNTLSQKLLLLQAVASGNARIASTATKPGSPSSPNRKATALVALIFGLLLGIGLAFLLHMLNRRVNSADEFEQLYGVRALAGIPRIANAARTRDEREVELEPFRMLLNSLSLLSPDRQVKTVLVTSAVPAEGKTTVAVGLARAVALSGSSVVLVEADLRRPSFAERMRVDSRAEGLTGSLSDGADPIELLQSPFASLPNFQVLAAGPVRPDAPNRLRPYDLARIFETLSAHADVVVVDSAPLLPVVDTRVLLDELPLDAYLVVARSGYTKREEIRSVRALFEQRRLKRSMGLVINALPERSGNYYYYKADDPSDGEPAREQERELVIDR